jgi:hypothetical protein
MLLLATGLIACGTKKESAPDNTQPAAAAKVVAGPPVDPATFAELDTSAWPVTKLPKAGVSLRIPKGVTITESGTLKMEPKGPYIGLTLASGYADVQIDTSSGEIADSTETAKQAEAAGEVKILVSTKDALVRQSTKENGCYVVACKTVGATPLCVSAGKKSILGANGSEKVSWPTLGDCASLLAIVRSLEPL